MTWLSRDLMAPGLRREIAAVLAKNGRVHIPNCLEPGRAEALLGALREQEWWLTFKDAEAVVEVPVAEFEALGVEKRLQAVRLVNAQARDGFQYLYEKVRIAEAVEAGVPLDPLLGSLFQSLNSQEMLEFFRAVTGATDVAYIDAQATRYRPGHFLTVHSDAIEVASRLYAYVVNLTPAWRLDWGGLLAFVAGDGHVSEALLPRWNALNIFRVPQPHLVTLVAPFAGAARYSITGWLRADQPRRD